MFRRRRAPNEAARTEGSQVDGASDDTGGLSEIGPSDRATGPWDRTEVDDPAAGRIDLGGLWLPQRPDMELRAQLDQKTQTVVEAVAVVHGNAALQLQAFAAPRKERIWPEIRGEIARGIVDQGGRAEEAEGPFGTELRAQVPARLPDGTAQAQSVRFVGVDGPRWFLRGVLTGAAYADPQAAAALEEVFRDIVVVRGGTAMAPREPIPMRLPRRPVEDPTPPDAAPEGDSSALRPFERGPEITEVR